jgi:hypothetical protein
LLRLNTKELFKRRRKGKEKEFSHCGADPFGTRRRKDKDQEVCTQRRRDRGEEKA